MGEYFVFYLTKLINMSQIKKIKLSRLLLDKAVIWWSNLPMEDRFKYKNLCYPEMKDSKYIRDSQKCEIYTLINTATKSPGYSGYHSILSKLTTTN